MAADGDGEKVWLDYTQEELDYQYELEPVWLSSRQEYLRLDEGMVARNSAMRQIPTQMPPFVVAYGEGEHVEFRRHSS